MKKEYNLYKKFMLVFTVITFFISFIVDKSEGYKYISFIPLTYFFSLLLFKRFHFYSRNNRGIFLLNIFMFIKYSISIFLICIFKNYDLPSYYNVYVNNLSYYYATFYIILEMLSIFIVIELFSSSIYKKTENKDILIAEHENIKIGPILLLFIGVALGLIILNRNTFLEKSLIIFSEKTSVDEVFATNNFLSVIFYAIKIIIMGLFINFFIVKYEKSKNKIYVLGSYIIMAIYIFLNISTSRINMILPFALFLIITRKEFGKTGKILNIFGIAILLFLFTIVSAYKNPWKYSKDSSASKVLIDFSTSIQEYTSNIMPTAIGLQAIEFYKNEISLDTLYNDFVGAIPVLSRTVNEENRIYRLYNMYALKNNTMSQLIPMTVSSIAYFSPFFCWLLVDLNVILLMFFDNRMKIKYKNFLSEYLCMYLLFIFASCLYSNVQILSGRFFVNYMPTAILLCLNNKIVIKKKKYPRGLEIRE